MNNENVCLLEKKGLKFPGEHYVFVIIIKFLMHTSGLCKWYNKDNIYVGGLRITKKKIKRYIKKIFCIYMRVEHLLYKFTIILLVGIG